MEAAPPSFYPHPSNSTASSTPSSSHTNTDYLGGSAGGPPSHSAASNTEALGLGDVGENEEGDEPSCQPQSSRPRPPSPKSRSYELKYKHLSQNCLHIQQSNNRLRNRIYHVRKEINHLKQLKRVLCERLLLHNAAIVDSNQYLEIPDDENEDGGPSALTGFGTGHLIGAAMGAAAANARQWQHPTKRGQRGGGEPRRRRRCQQTQNFQVKQELGTTNCAATAVPSTGGADLDESANDRMGAVDGDGNVRMPANFTFE